MATDYSADLPLAENPISESGYWVNGASLDLDWADVLTPPGQAIGLECQTGRRAVAGGAPLISREPVLSTSLDLVSYLSQW